MTCLFASSNDIHNQLKTHWSDFLKAYNFARRIKTYKGQTWRAMIKE